MAPSSGSSPPPGSAPLLIVLSPHSPLEASSLCFRWRLTEGRWPPWSLSQEVEGCSTPVQTPLLSTATFSLPFPQLSTPKENADLLHLNALCVTSTLFLLVSALPCARRDEALLGWTLEGLDALEHRVDPSQGRLSPGSSYSGASPTPGDVPRLSSGRHPARTKCPQSVLVTSLGLDKA